MNAVPHHLAHFLRDNTGHGVDRLEKRPKSFREIGNLDPIPGAEQHHHCLTNDAAKAEQNGGDNAGKGRRHEHASDRLQAIRAQRIRGFLETAGHIPQGIFGERS